VSEVVVDGVTGVICEQPAELPAAIERAGSLDPHACRRHVAANFGVAQLGSGYERIYHRLLDGDEMTRAAGNPIPRRRESPGEKATA
jgi:hypothetical protein